jgi:hypothetical protein
MQETTSGQYCFCYKRMLVQLDAKCLHHQCNFQNMVNPLTAINGFVIQIPTSPTAQVLPAGKKWCNFILFSCIQ